MLPNRFLDAMDALLVIDVQKALVQGAYHESEVLCAIQIAVEKVRARGGLILYIQHCHDIFEPMKKGNAGWDLHDALDVRENDLLVEKEASDSFYNSGLDKLLNAHGVDQLFVVGLQTEYCVDATCRSALSKGYKVTLISDGHTTGDALLPAAQIIAHHNMVLGNLAHPKNKIQLRTSSDI